MQEILCHKTCIDYTSFASDIDLTAVRPRGARRILVKDVTAGTTLAVITGDGTARTYTVAANDDFPATEFLKIKNTTTVTKLRVFF